MKICVLNGSPKGKYSVTLQTVLYLEKKFPDDTFSVVHIGQLIKQYEKDMSKPLAEIAAADLILFAYPVYTFIAPSQLHRFIELLKAADVDLGGKYATQITTSKHFYDVTAHKYVEENCFDLGLKVIKGLSADMEDLTKTAGQADAVNFYEYVRYCISNVIYEEAPKAAPQTTANYVASLPSTAKKDGFDTVIVADVKENDEALKNMIADFRAVYPYNTRIVNIREYPFAGGCLGCFNCAADGTCVYKDKFDEFLRGNIQKSAAVVYAFTISDHSMGSRFKTYDDRQFCNGHRTVTEGMPFAYVVNGNIDAEANLKTVIEGRAEVGHNFLAGIACDPDAITATAERLAYAVEHNYLQPRNFYGVGGMKIFRDLIWGMRGIMRADHKYYKQHGIYDFPQKKRGQMILMLFLGALTRNKKIREKAGANMMNEGMLMPYKKIIDNVDKK